MKHISIGFSIHRPEMVPVTARIMEQHDVIFLEEPPEVNFENMLNRTLGVEDYLMPLDMEYPEFSRKMCCLERDLYASGKQLIQVEPFVEALLSIHEFFAQGNKPEDLKKGQLTYFVYLAERNATGALIKYYRTVLTGSFEATVEAIRQFAKADAARFRLRDSLRAQEIARQTGEHTAIFVEAGTMHYLLWQQLRPHHQCNCRLSHTPPGIHPNASVLIQLMPLHCVPYSWFALQETLLHLQVYHQW